MWRFDDLAIFITVVERGSFIAAANKLDIPSSTVSRRLSRLEADLNIKLLERTSRKIHLTEIGKRFFAQCAPHIQQLRENTLSLTESVDQIHGKLKITAPTYLGNKMIADWFLEFIKQNPTIELDIVLSNDIRDILDEEIDIAIRVGPLEDSTFIARHLWDMGYVLCASASYIDNNSLLESPDDIQHHHAIVFRDQQFPWRFRHAQTGQESQIYAQGRVISNDMRLAIYAVENGLGIACFPLLAVNQKLIEGKLITLLPQYELLNRRSAFAVYPSKRYLPKKTQLLLDYIKEKSISLCDQVVLY